MIKILLGKFLVKLSILGAFSFIIAAIIATSDESISLPVWGAIIIGGCGIIGPMLLGYMQSRSRHKDKIENWDREDARAKQTNGQLKEIHTLVNSNLTEALRAELESTMRELASLKLIVDLNRERGREPTIEALALIGSTEKRIKELQVNLDHRVKQAKLLDQTHPT